MCVGQNGLVWWKAEDVLVLEDDLELAGTGHGDIAVEVVSGTASSRSRGRWQGARHNVVSG